MEINKIREASGNYDIIKTKNESYKVYHNEHYKTHAETEHRIIYLLGRGVCIGKAVGDEEVLKIIQEYEDSTFNRKKV